LSGVEGYVDLFIIPIGMIEEEALNSINALQLTEIRIAVSAAELPVAAACGGGNGELSGARPRSTRRSRKQ